MNYNVVIIVMDALKAESVGAIQDEDDKNLTPNLDRLASGSAVFNNAFTSITMTDPAVTSLQTGKHPLAHGVVNHGRFVTGSEKAQISGTPQLPSILSDTGYHTVKLGRPLGRWHKEGFDIYPEFGERRGQIQTSRKRKFYNKIKHISPTAANHARKLYRHIQTDSLGDSDRKVGVGKDETNDADRVLERFQTLLAEENTPFYHFIHLMDTHNSRTVGEEIVKMNFERFEYPEISFEEILSMYPQGSETRNKLLQTRADYDDVLDWWNPDEDSWSALEMAHYDATVQEADARINNFIEELKSQDEWNTTLFIVLSDHGNTAFTQNEYRLRHSVYDSAIRIPLIINTPEDFFGTYDNLVQITDIAPTVLDYVDTCNTLSADGESLRPIIESSGSVEREAVLVQESYAQCVRALRTKNRKLVYPYKEPNICRLCDIEHVSGPLLFHIDKDPDETRSVLTDNDDEATDLMTFATELESQFSQSSKADPESTEEVYEDEEELYDQLDALGYR